MNLAAGQLRMVMRKRRLSAPEAALLSGGERDVLAAFRTGGFDAIVSDDQRVLMRLEGLGVPYLTPGALLVVLGRRRWLEGERVAALLERLQQWISTDEYAVCRMALEALEEVSRNEGHGPETP